MNYIITPVNQNLITAILKDPITGEWNIPILTFNANYDNPFYDDLNVLNNDHKYRQKIIDYFYTCLTEKWLYKDPVFEQLLPYFKISKTKFEGKVCLITNNKKPDMDSNIIYKKFIFKYIETFFVTRIFVEKILKSYVKHTNTKWYDLLNNKTILKGLFAYKIKKIIIGIIENIRNKK
ncbi:hypothetical protein [Acanthamoeba castellanii mimivirus]|uniref:Uncharacterized protein L360 n=5 Tax=Mimivirus TaxID=315393 RepID=YL360_MIMIV|nr:hypothetical protein MIMI_gp0390 [Acanthamoeba polyphaga mimivirus]Q5UQU5.1 RecName: Full=Uncharacterized protein L360 [Acanthamoeba polyphaga mimivirus]AHA45503.1 hypothetical protein HIRU_S597 [Hirudovirus strain Sangsue]AHJ40069.1 hypothetical protein [Samba virus]ALR83940.1 hypothetical protein [Niemeyer virus]AMZ02805.1 hypothetical protein [Mimivirus Bombay]QTF49274.1 hypothetical protein [Mimivirus reunion]WMV61717.1 hypothetical protein qu_382 [Mimivirus sp.]BAV61462.1 hypothetic